jgi:S-(hydroxymethyl)glutathione dehydrogenase / alcohol dehydrogenase
VSDTGFPQRAHLQAICRGYPQAVPDTFGFGVTRVRAAVCHAFGEPLAVEEVDVASPAAGEVSVDVAASGICHSDVAYGNGDWGGTLPAVYGHEAAGVVAEVGPAVETHRPGDRVLVTSIRFCGRCRFCAAGSPALCSATLPPSAPRPLSSQDGRPVEQGMRVASFAERVTVHASQAVPLADGIHFATAALLGCTVITGVGAVLNDAGVQPGESVVVVGCGGVGLNSVQAAVLVPAHPIVAVDPAAEKLAAARDFGATHTVDPTTDDVVEAVRAETHGEGADHAIVTAGAAQAVTDALVLVRRGGTVTVVGMPAYGAPASFDATLLAHDSVRIVGSKLGSTRPHTDVPKLLALYRAGRLKLDELVSGRYPLERVNEAIASAAQPGVLRNVIVPDARA